MMQKMMSFFMMQKMIDILEHEKYNSFRFCAGSAG